MRRCSRGPIVRTLRACRLLLRSAAAATVVITADPIGGGLHMGPQEVVAALANGKKDQTIGKYTKRRHDAIVPPTRSSQTSRDWVTGIRSMANARVSFVTSRTSKTPPIYPKPAYAL